MIFAKLITMKVSPHKEVRPLRKSATFKDQEKKKTINDQEVWNKFRNGNESAFILIYETYFKDLYRYASQFTANKELIKDVVQDLFIDLRKKRKHLGDAGSIKFYLYKSIRRRLIAELKRSERHKASIEKGHLFEFTISAEQAIIERQFNAEQIKELNKALEGLSSRQREAVYYHFYENLGYDQIRQLMSFNNVKSVRNLIYRSLTVLRSTVRRLVLTIILPLIPFF